MKKLLVLLVLLSAFALTSCMGGEQETPHVHSFTTYVSDDNATCTANGTETAKCVGCDVTDTREVANSKVSHSFTTYKNDNNATCESNGTKTSKCDNCDATDTKEVADSKLAHSFTTYVSDDNATCESNCTETAKCDDCDATDTRDVADSKLPHSFVPDLAAGKYVCEDCGEPGTELVSYTCNVEEVAGVTATLSTKSAYISSEISITFEETDNSYLYGLKVNGEFVGRNSLTLEDNGTYTYKVRMVMDGLTILPIVASESNLTVEVSNNQLNGYKGTAIELPLCTVVDSFGNDLSDLLVIIDETDSDAEINGQFITTNVLDEHTIVYQIVNPTDNSVITSETITLTISDRLLAGSSAKDSETSGVVVENEETDPVLSITNTGYSAVSFNTSGKYYYVEMTMSQLSSYVNGQIYALTHNISSLGDPSEGTYYSGFKFNADNYEYANSKYMLTNWGAEDARAWLPSAYSDARVDGLNASFKTGTTKIAIARVGDYFYYFVNDKLYAYALYPELASENTYPGLLFRGNGSEISAEFSNFEFIREQNEIQNKVNSLIGGSTFERYVNKTESSTYVTFDNNGATYKTAAELGGTAGADTNNTAANLRVSPYVHVYGNWEISYDVTPSTLGDSDNYGKLILLVSTLQDRQNVFEWYDLTNSTSFLLGSACGNSNISANTDAAAIKIKTIDGSTIQPFARSYGTYHVTVKCEVKENLIETYTISITAGENNEVNMSATFDIQYTSQTYLHGGAKWFCFKSEKWAGTISNFTIKNI